MKKLLLLLTLTLSFNAFSQTTLTLTNYDSKDFVWKKGDNEFVTVKFSYTLEEKIDKEILDKVVMTIMTQSKFALKNTYSFVPKELMIFKVEDKYNGFTQYLGKNAFGAEGISKSYFEFDLEGNVVLKFTN